MTNVCHANDNSLYSLGSHNISCSIVIAVLNVKSRVLILLLKETSETKNKTSICFRQKPAELSNYESSQDRLSSKIHQVNKRTSIQYTPVERMYTLRTACMVTSGRTSEE